MYEGVESKRFFKRGWTLHTQLHQDEETIKDNFLLILCVVVFAFPSPRDASAAAVTSPAANTGRFFMPLFGLKWTNSRYQTLKCLLYQAPSKCHNTKGCRNYFAGAELQYFLHELSNGNLVSLWRYLYWETVSLCKIMGKPTINEIIRMGTKLKREVLSLIKTGILWHSSSTTHA